jgi:hypothetical protein
MAPRARQRRRAGTRASARHRAAGSRELTEESITSLIEHWLPKAKAEVKQTADDKRLINGLTWYQAKFKTAEESQMKLEQDDVPY